MICAIPHPATRGIWSACGPDRSAAAPQRCIAAGYGWGPALADVRGQTPQNAVAAAGRQIDALVYEFYHLTAEEIALVDAPPQMGLFAKAQCEAKPERTVDLI